MVDPHVDPHVDLRVDALAVAVRTQPRLRPPTALAPRNHRRLVARSMARQRGVPEERMRLREPVPDDPADAADFALTGRLLDALGARERDHPLFLVRSGPPVDPMVAGLAGATHATGWTGEDVGVTHLAERGGTQIFRLLSWAVPEGDGATVLIVDDPAQLDVEARRPAFAAVGLRVRRAGPGPGTGALRVVACGDTPPGASVAEPPARHVLTGAGPCDPWLDLHEALSAGEVGRGDRVLLRTADGARRPWVLVEAAQPGELTLANTRLVG